MESLKWELNPKMIGCTSGLKIMDPAFRWQNKSVCSISLRVYAARINPAAWESGLPSVALRYRDMVERYGWKAKPVTEPPSILLSRLQQRNKWLAGRTIK